MADWTFSDLTTAIDATPDALDTGSSVSYNPTLTTTYGTKSIGELTTNASKLITVHGTSMNYSFNPMRPVKGQMYPRFNK